MVKILILEDDPNRVDIFRATLGNKHSLTFTETAAAAIAAIDETPFDIIFLDHDLGGEQYVSETNVNTGSEVVRYLMSNNCSSNIDTTIIVHSMNFPAAGRMVSNLLSAGYTNTHRIPFSHLAGKYLMDPGFIV